MSVNKNSAVSDAGHPGSTVEHLVLAEFNGADALIVIGAV